MNYGEMQTAAPRSGNMLRAAAIGLLLAAGACGAAVAQTAPRAQAATPGQPAQAAAPAKPKVDPGDKVICRDEEEIGTRLGGHRECHTKRQWDQMAKDGADMVNNRHQEGSAGK